MAKEVGADRLGDFYTNGKVRKRRVFVYIMHEDRPIGIPSVSYMQTCIQGYDDFGFDRLTLIDAYLKCGEEHHEGK